MVQVSSEKAKDEDRGTWGEVVSEGGLSLTFTDVETGALRTVRRALLLSLQRVPTDPAPERKNCGHITQRQKEQMKAFFHTHMPPIALVKGSKERLECSQIDAGSLEILWRTGPGVGVVCQPAYLTCICAERQVRATWLEEHSDEGALAFQAWRARARRSDLLLCPVNNGGGHWTLLVLERKGGSEHKVKATPESGPWQELQNLQHKVTAPDYNLRKAEENLQLSVEEWPEREGGSWEMRYYDSLRLELESSRLVGQAILLLAKASGLEVSTTLPARCNEGQQEALDGTSCGFWVLHYMEEECRRRRGEGTFSFVHNLSHREERLQQILKVLVPKGSQWVPLTI